MRRHIRQDKQARIDGAAIDAKNLDLNRAVTQPASDACRLQTADIAKLRAVLALDLNRMWVETICRFGHKIHSLANSEPFMIRLTPPVARDIKDKAERPVKPVKSFGKAETVTRQPA